MHRNPQNLIKDKKTCSDKNGKRKGSFRQHRANQDLAQITRAPCHTFIDSQKHCEMQVARRAPKAPPPGTRYLTVTLR